MEKTLKLVANPWAAIDANGRACGACPRDPVEDNGALGFIGAVRVVDEVVRVRKTQIIGGKEVESQTARTTTRFDFSPDPVTVPDTGYYRDRAGKVPYELFPADAATAAALGLPKFVAPKDLIEQHRKLRVAEFDGQHGVGAWQELEDARNPPTTAKAGK